MGINRKEKAAIFFNPRCKQWACDFCGEQNKSYWVHQATRGALIFLSEGQELQFITLTGRGYFTPTSSIYFFRQNWPKLRKRAAKLTNGWSPWTNTFWSYFLVPERHKSGILHAHLIATTHLEGKRWWKDNAWATGFGHQTDVITIDSAGKVGGYVTKYLHKDAGGIQWPKGFMRVRHSQDWPIAKEKPLKGWEWQGMTDKAAWLEKGALVNMGFEVIDKRKTW